MGNRNLGKKMNKIEKTETVNYHTKIPIKWNQHDILLSNLYKPVYSHQDLDDDKNQ